MQFAPSSDLKQLLRMKDTLISIFGNIIANACDALSQREEEGRRILILARNRTDRISVVIANNGPPLVQTRPPTYLILYSNKPPGQAPAWPLCSGWSPCIMVNFCQL